MQQPYPSFAQIRVLDLTDRWGQFATRLLAQLGADVVIGEPPAGHELRRAWPMAPAGGDSPMSLYFWHFNMGKRSVLWDLDSEDGRSRAEELLRACDVVMTGRDSYRQIREWMPDAIETANVVVLSAYGLGHPDALGNDDLHVSAQTGVAGLSGYGTRDRSEPVIPPLEQTMHSAGVYGAIAALLALRAEKDGSGYLFDVSAQASSFQSTEVLFAHTVYRKEKLYRQGGGYATSAPSGRWQITGVDGSYIYAFGLLPRTQKAWDALREWMKREGSEDDVEELSDPRFSELASLRGTNPYDVSDDGRYVTDVIARFLSSIPAERAYRVGQSIGLSWARVFQPEDVLGEEQFVVREFFSKTAVRDGGPTYWTQSLPWRTTTASTDLTDSDAVYPPQIGEHTEMVASQWLGLTD